jgi:alkyl sulfatase BDS1-like metallo-beta-lactamase superfamily hydrolase
MRGGASMPKLLRAGDAKLEGGLLKLVSFAGLFERFTPDFEIVRP